MHEGERLEGLIKWIHLAKRARWKESDLTETLLLSPRGAKLQHGPAMPPTDKDYVCSRRHFLRQSDLSGLKIERSGLSRFHQQGRKRFRLNCVTTSKKSTGASDKGVLTDHSSVGAAPFVTMTPKRHRANATCQ